jgi:hypothetical protein
MYAVATGANKSRKKTRERRRIHIRSEDLYNTSSVTHISAVITNPSRDPAIPLMPPPQLLLLQAQRLNVFPAMISLEPIHLEVLMNNTRVKSSVDRKDMAYRLDDLSDHQHAGW